MKKFIFTVIFMVSLTVGSSLFAEKISEGHESAYFYVNVTLEKIYPYRKGYVVQYRKGVNQFAEAYIPNEWFLEAESKAEAITLPRGKGWPSLTVYYKEGEFSHVRLYLHPLRGHKSWGNIPVNVNIDDKFENVEEIKLEF